MSKKQITYVLHIEFADDPLRVAVFNSLEDAEQCLDVFMVTVFDPPQNDDFHALPFRARILECKGKGVSQAFEYKRGDVSNWATEISTAMGG